MKSYRRSRFENLLSWTARAALILTLSACVGQEAFRRGEELLAKEQWEEAIGNLRQATREDKDNREYQAVLKRAMDRAVATLLGEAARARNQQKNDAARESYRRVLTLEPGNERAAEGIGALEKAERYQRLYADADRSVKAGREREARALLKKILDEAPSHAQARELLRTLDEKSGRSGAAAALALEHRKPVSLEFRDASLRSVFDALTHATGLNFVFDRDLRQDTKITVYLRNVPFDQALDQITSSNGLGQRIVNANTLLIYPAQPQKIREYQDLMVRSFFLANADVKQMINLLKTILKVKDAYIDEKRNLLVVRDTEEVIRMAEKLVATHDQPEPEVVLEVEILEFNHTTDNELGLKFPEKVSFGLASPITVDAVRAANGSVTNVTGLNPYLTLNLRRELNDINLLANPRIRVRNREKAKFHIGDKVPVITSTLSTTTSVSTSSVSYLDVGIKLEFEPAIQLDDDVVIKTSLEVSSITRKVESGGTTAYEVGTRNAATTLTLRDGETQVLAGLLRSEESDTASRFPGLGDLPVLGHIFNSRTVKGGRKEILLSITPHIVRNLNRPTEDLVEFNFGPESGRQGGGQAVAVGGSPPPIAIPPGMVGGAAVSPAPTSIGSGGPPILPNFSGFGSTGSSTTSTPSTTTTSPPSPGSSSTTATPAPRTPTSFPDFEPPPGVGSR